MPTWRFRKAVALGLSLISPPPLKAFVLRWCCDAEVDRGARIGWLAAVAAKRVRLGARATIRPLTVISLDGNLELGADAEISSFTLAYGSSTLVVGPDSYVGPQSLINADEPVVVGRQSALGARSMVFTHGSFLPYTEGYFSRRAPVHIGDRVHCAAGVFVHPGARIGSDSFVNSRSVVSGEIPDGSTAQGNPAAVTGSMDRFRRRMTPERVDLAIRHMLQEYAEVGLGRELDIAPVQQDTDALRFVYRGVRYRVSVVPSSGDAPSFETDDEPDREVWLANRAGWAPARPGLVLDFASGTTAPSGDPVHRSLRAYLLRYYGVRIKDR